MDCLNGHKTENRISMGVTDQGVWVVLTRNEAQYPQSGRQNMDRGYEATFVNSIIIALFRLYVISISDSDDSMTGREKEESIHCPCPCPGVVTSFH
jgi:hypothetical protein